MNCTFAINIFVLYFTLLMLGGVAGGLVAGFVISGYIKGMPKE